MKRLLVCLSLVILLVLLGLALSGCKPDNTPSNSTIYDSCQEARDAGAAPLNEGDPGYNSKLDRNHDGVACE